MTASATAVPGPATPSAPPPARSAQRRWVPYLLLAPGMAWLVVFFALPMLTLASTSLYDPSGSVREGYAFTFHVANYLTAARDYAEHFVRAFSYAGIATVLALVISYPLAYTIAFKAGRWRNLLLVLVIAPFFTSFLVRTLAWTTILGDAGPVVGALRTVGLLDETGRLLATPVAVVAGLTYNFLPFMTLPLFASLDRIDHRLIEAAGDLYASAATAFRRVTLPLSLPGVVAGTLLTFIPASGDYVNSALLGTPSTYMIGNVIESQFLRVLNYPTAAALSILLMLVIVVLVAGYVRRVGTEEVV